jgi:hypothetical protein
LALFFWFYANTPSPCLRGSWAEPLAASVSSQRERVSLGSSRAGGAKKFRTRKCAEFLLITFFTLHFSLTPRVRNFR